MKRRARPAVKRESPKKDLVSNVLSEARTNYWETSFKLCFESFNKPSGKIAKPFASFIKHSTKTKKPFTSFRKHSTRNKKISERFMNASRRF